MSDIAQSARRAAPFRLDTHRSWCNSPVDLEVLIALVEVKPLAGSRTGNWDRRPLRSEHLLLFEPHGRSGSAPRTRASAQRPR